MASHGLTMSARLRGLHPGLGGGEELGGRDDLVDQAGGLRGGGGEHLAFEEQRRGGHRAHHPDEAGGAAGAGEDADQDLGEADPGLRIVGHEAAVAGERDLGADAGGEAGEGAGDRLAALQGLRVGAGALDLPQQPVHGHDAVEDAGGGVGAGGLFHAGEDVEVHAGGEVGLGAGQDDALDGGVGEGGVDGGVEVGDALVGEDVHRLAGQVPGDGGDAVGVDVGGEDRHPCLPRSCRVAAFRRGPPLRPKGARRCAHCFFACFRPVGRKRLLSRFQGRMKTWSRAGLFRPAR